MFFYTLNYCQDKSEYVYSDIEPARHLGHGKFLAKNAVMEAEFQEPGCYKFRTPCSTNLAILDEPGDRLCFTFFNVADAAQHQSGLLCGISSARAMSFKKFFVGPSRG